MIADDENNGLKTNYQVDGQFISDNNLLAGLDQKSTRSRPMSYSGLIKAKMTKIMMLYKVA